MSGGIPQTIWITWEGHRRTRNIAAALGIPLFELRSRRPRWQRHPYLAVRTARILLRERPRVVVVQNPSMFLTLTAIILKPFFRYRLVVDAHNAGVYPCEASHHKFSRVYPLFHKAADLTVVTNPILAQMVAANGGRVHELIDPLPSFEPPKGNAAVTQQQSDADPAVATITYICTYAADEPYEEVLRAAAGLRGEARIHVTGNIEANRHRIAVEPPDNVVFTGFLPEDEFVALLRRSDAIVDLTTLPDCLVCGGYEAVSLGVPLVLSDTPANRYLFTPGAVLAGNEAADLTRALREVLRSGEAMRCAVRLLRHRLAHTWRHQFEAFRGLLQREIGQNPFGSSPR